MKTLNRTPGPRASGVWRARQSFYAADLHCSHPARAGRNDAQEMDCARDCSHGARCAANGAFRCFDSRYPPACLDETPAGHSGGTSGQWWRTASGRLAKPDLPASTLQTLVRRELVRIEERTAPSVWAGSSLRRGRSRSTNRKWMRSPLSFLTWGSSSFFTLRQ